jgi:murein DD-endopeptidase MepM/ murein hydrolase activator NlpD
LLDDPKTRSGLPYVALVVIAALIGAGAYYYGRRAGLKAQPVSAVVVTPPAQPAAAPTAMGADAGAAEAPPTVVATSRSPDAGATSEQAGGHQLLSAVLIGSLDQTVEGAAPPTVGPALAMVVARLLVWWMQPAQDARPGDRLDVLYDTPAGQEPLIQALAYRSQKNAAEYRAYRYQPPGARFAHYYRADGSELEERLVGGPIEDYEQVTSLLRDGRGHKGVDFKAPLGTPVSSPVNGTILRRNWHWRANGNCLEIVDAQSGRHVIFLHLEEIPKSMEPGMKVHAGEQVALSGNTGHTTAPHLHYQLMSPDGRVLDPFKIHKTDRRRLPADQLAAFKAVAARLDALLHVPPA